MEKTLSERFYKEANKWFNETRHLSSPSQIMSHSSYQAILNFPTEDKNETIKLMLQDLQENRRPWFWALFQLTGENPVNPSDAGNINKMIEAWIKWGKEKFKLDKAEL